jgi:hypothetical protein
MLAQLLKETLLLYVCSAKRKGEGREFPSEIKEEADGGGKATQPTGSRFTLYH